MRTLRESRVRLRERRRGHRVDLAKIFQGFGVVVVRQPVAEMRAEVVRHREGQAAQEPVREANAHGHLQTEQPPAYPDPRRGARNLQRSVGFRFGSSKRRHHGLTFHEFVVMAQPSSKSKLTPEALYAYAIATTDKAIAEGRGSDFPTFRMAARHFKVKLADIETAISDWQGRGYMQAAVARGGSGGYFAYERLGDHQVEAYREEGVETPELADVA